MQCTNCGAELQLGATVCPVCEARVVPTKKSVAPPRKRAVKTAAPVAATKPSAAPVPAAVAPAEPAPTAPVASVEKPGARPARRPAAKPVRSAASGPASSGARSAGEKPAFPAAAVRAIAGAFAWVRSKYAGPSRPRWLVPVSIAVGVVVVAGAAWLGFSGATNGANTPEAAALRMMQAYGSYDAATLLANSTHATLTPAAETAFLQQYAKAKATAKGPAIKDIAITKVIIDSTDPTEATVKVSEQVLDPNTGTYSPRTDTLSLVEQNGRWLVRLF